MIIYLTSILMGLIAGYIITTLLLKRYYIKYKGPNSNDIKKKYFKYNNKYYIFTTEICFCPCSF